MVVLERGKYTTHLQDGEAAQEGSQLPGFCQLYVIQNYRLRASFWVSVLKWGILMAELVCGVCSGVVNYFLLFFFSSLFDVMSFY